MKKNLPYILLFVVVLVVTSLFIWIFIYQSRNIDSSIVDNSPVEQFQEGNKLILQSPTSKRYEGKNIPKDIQELDIFINLPITSDLLEVIDVHEPGYRMVTIKYRVYRTMEDLKTIVNNELGEKELNIQQELSQDSIKVSNGDLSIYIALISEGRSEQLVSITYIINNQ
jgi:hypothetical protein